MSKSDPLFFFEKFDTVLKCILSLQSQSCDKLANEYEPGFGTTVDHRCSRMAIELARDVFFCADKFKKLLEILSFVYLYGEGFEN